MAEIISKEILKYWYQAANRLVAAHFAATFDSFYHKSEPINAQNINGLSSKFEELEKIAHESAKIAFENVSIEIQKLSGENLQPGISLANLNDTTNTILEMLGADDKDINALRELASLINQNIDKIEDMTSKKLDIDEFSLWILSDFQDALSQIENHSHHEFIELDRKAHTHPNRSVIDQTSAAFTSDKDLKLTSIEPQSNRYIHPNKPATGSDETFGPSKFVSGITADNHGHIVKLITKEANAPNTPLILNYSGVIDSAFLPSYVDDVLEYPLLTNLPLNGESGKIYVVYNDTSDKNGQYRWSGSAYILISQPIDIASDSEAKLGSNDHKLVTPLKMLSAFLYWISSKAIGAFTKSNTVVSSSDSIVGAIGKLQGQLEGTTPITKGGTGATDPASARTNLGIIPANIGAASSVHSHTLSEIGGLQSLLDQKSPSSHDHSTLYEPKDTSLQANKHGHTNKSTIDSITSSMVSTWNGLLSFVGFAINGSSTAGKAVEANDIRLSDARTPTAHTHSKINITDFAHSHASGDLPTYPTLISLGGVSTSDSRLSDARTPTTHSHSKAYITDFPTSLPANGGNADTVDGLHAAVTGAIAYNQLVSANSSGHIQAKAFYQN